MKVLFVTAEAYPFMKAGGLGDVAYSLTKALRNINIDIRIIMPKYKLPKKIKKKMKKLSDYKTYIGWKIVDCSLWYLEWNDIPFYFIDNPYYFCRERAYGYSDDEERFIYFSKAVLEGIKYLGDFRPEVIHCNDWHTALCIPLKNIYYMGSEIHKNIKTVFTIHNICYQGTCSKDSLWMLGLDENKYFIDEELKHHDGISFMKWAILKSDVITTVSKVYSNEILKPWIGYGMEDVLKKRRKNLFGITNGIDYNIFNPEKDKEIWNNYNENSLENRRLNKLKLQEQFKLIIDKDIPVIAVICRLTEQKGFSLIENSISRLVDRNFQIIIMGDGESYYKNMIKYMQEKYRGKVRAIPYFNTTLSKQIYSGADMFLMPSKFEPCGLGQLIAMRYGVVPIVRETGGLKETVIQYNKYTEEGTGFTFINYDVEAMIETIDRAYEIYKDKEKWIKLQKSIMKRDNTWSKASGLYEEIYKSL